MAKAKAKAKATETENVIAPKKTTKAKVPITKESVKDIALTTELVYRPKTPFVFESNIPIILEEVKTVLAKYKKLKITDKNFDEATLVKRRLVSLRTTLKSREREALATDVTPLVDRTKAAFKLVTKDVIELEAHLDAQFAVFEQEEIDAKKVIYQEYIDNFQKTYNISQKFFDIEMKDRYFNKTIKEKEVIEDIEAQFKDLKKREDEYDGNVELIKQAIEGDEHFNEDMLVESLDYRSITVILQDIATEKKRFNAIANGKSTDGIPTIKVGLAQSVSFASKAREKKTTATFKVTYYASQGASIKAFLDESGFDYEILSKEEDK